MTSGVSNEAEERRGIGLSAVEWLLALALTVAFVPAWIELSKVWSRYDYYSHGYLVPLAALWAATAQRRVFARLPIERSTIGGGVLAVGLALYLFARLAAIVSLQGIAFIVSLAGAVWFARGRAWLESLAFAISYLVFMVPVPENLITPLIAKLQLFVSATAIPILHALGIAVQRDGNVMWLPGGESLFVAEACSGITSILTLVPLAVFLAYFTQRGLARRAVLVVAVIPLAMLGNLLRVVITVWLAQHYSVELATGDFLHTWAGLATYAVGCLALLAVGRLMDHLVPEEKTPLPQ